MMFKNGLYHYFFTDKTICNHIGKYLGNWEVFDGILFDVNHLNRNGMMFPFPDVVQEKYRQWLTNEILKEKT